MAIFIDDDSGSQYLTPVPGEADGDVGIMACGLVVVVVVVESTRAVIQTPVLTTGIEHIAGRSHEIRQHLSDGTVVGLLPGQ
jgi:hypothetical protein